MGKITLNDISLNTFCVVDEIGGNLPERIIKRLSSLGIIRNSKVMVLKRSKLSASGIVYVLGAKVCLDKKILSSVFVREV